LLPALGSTPCAAGEKVIQKKNLSKDNISAVTDFASIAPRFKVAQHNIGSGSVRKLGVRFPYQRSMGTSLSNKGGVPLSQGSMGTYFGVVLCPNPLHM